MGSGVPGSRWRIVIKSPSCSGAITKPVNCHKSTRINTPLSVTETPPLILQHAEIFTGTGSTRLADIEIRRGRITALSEAPGTLTAESGGEIIDARGGLLLPGLNDHHVHLASYAASLASVACGPPDVNNEAELSAALDQPGDGWLRGTGFHESVTADLNRAWLDKHGPDRPVRIQHRSGRLWVLNSLAMTEVAAAAENLPIHERQRLQSHDGCLYDVDELLGSLLRRSAPPMAEASRRLANFGITGINDMTPSNDLETWQWFEEMIAAGDLLQRVRMSGRPGLSGLTATHRLTTGETKIHLHDSALPDFAEFVETIRHSHGAERAIAVHCVTEVELVFTLSALRVAGAAPGDRIEHASVVPPALIEQLLELGVSVVTQPNFIAERGDTYIRDIPAAEHPYLYRVQSLTEHGVPVAFGTDLPFGDADPWRAIAAAVNRKTRQGEVLGENEKVSAETALAAFLGSLDAPFESRQLLPGTEADLCLMTLPWHELRQDPDSRHVRLTMIAGEICYQA